jgi:tetratricopeptide (TPR) repeat protein
MTFGAAAVLLLAALAAGPDPEALVEQLQRGTVAERRQAAALLGEIGDAGVVGALARALRDPDPGVRMYAQAALWTIWLRSGQPDVDALLREGIAHMEVGRYGDALSVFSEVIRRMPEFAEGWNKRATVYYLMGEFDRSLADCEEVVKRNPQHFGALSGFGLNHLHKGNLERAAEYFERALTVNPNLEQIEALLGEIREVLLARRRQSI